MIAGDRTNVQHVRLNAEGDQALALSTLAAKIGGDAVFNSINVVAGSATSRHQVFAILAGENTNLRVNGATMLKGRQHADSTLVVEHAAPHCESRELFKTVIDDEATGVFQGKIIVPPHAQKTDGRMMSAALLLSEGGAMNNKPELEIFADDVQCAHGATCGQLDEDLLFYLMARGLPKKEAESLLVQAFLGEALEFVENEAVRESLIGTVEGWLKAGPDTLLRHGRVTAIEVGCRRRSFIGSGSPGTLTLPTRGGKDQNDERTFRTLRRRGDPGGVPDPGASRSTASRSSISTTPPRRRSRAR